MEYKVVWSIELDANSYEDAARKALHWITDPETNAHVFDVTEVKSSFSGTRSKTCVTVTIDLDE